MDAGENFERRDIYTRQRSDYGCGDAFRLDVESY